VALNQKPMRIDRLLSCPGKLFAAGEYSVLWGGTALLFGVGPRALAQVKSREDRQVNVLTVSGRLSGVLTPLGVSWTEPVDDSFRFVAGAVSMAAQAAGREGLGFTAAFSPTEVIGGQKLGLGSSARATVLATECARIALAQRFDTAKLAIVSHFDTQKSRGSGGDVAACFTGGSIRYRRFDAATVLRGAHQTSVSQALSASPALDVSLRPPPACTLVYAFAGASASTTQLVSSVEATFSAHQRAAFVVQSDELVAALATALGESNFDTIKHVTVELQKLLSSLLVGRDDRLDRLLALSRSLGAAAKQSGAGGGDGALLFCPSASAAGEVLEGLQQRGFHAFILSIEPGLRAEASGGERFAPWFDAVD
jgi:phosphomevalonate kinase